MRKLFAFLFRKGDHFFQKPPSVGVLNDAWKDFKSVVHLWASMYFVDSWIQERTRGLENASLPPDMDSMALKWEMQNEVAPDWQRAWYALAHDIQEFGLTYKPLNASAPLLDSDVLLKLVGVQDCSIKRPHVRFTSQMLEEFEDF